MSKRRMGIERRIEDAGERRWDIGRNVGILGVWVERLTKRVEELDTEGFRRQACRLYDVGDSERLGELLHRGADEDAAWRALVDGAERMASLQMGTLELAARNEGRMTVREVAGTLRKVMEIVAAEVHDAGARKAIYMRVSREIMGIRVETGAIEAPTDETASTALVAVGGEEPGG